MADKIENIVLEHLKAIRGDLSNLTNGQRLTNERLAAIEHHMAGFHVTVSNHSEELDTLKERIDRIERRLHLSDSPQS